MTSLENTQPLPTFTILGPDLYFVSDPRGYGTIIDLLASKYLKTEKGHITDSRLKLNKVVVTSSCLVNSAYTILYMRILFYRY